MSKRKKAAKIVKRRPRSRLGIVCALFALAALAFKVYEYDSEGKVTDPAILFEAFASLDIGGDQVLRMRNSPFPPRQKPASARWRTIVKVMDGDTLRLDGGEIVRLIGVDAPESRESRKLREDIHKMDLPVRPADMVRLGETATAFVKRVGEGRRCWLEYEKEPKDQYGRFLAYVHLEDGGVLNEEILANGFGKTYLGYPFMYKKRYILLQAEASMNKRGLWRGQ